MGKSDKNEERKRYNAPFLAAFEYLMKRFLLNQTELADMLKTSSSHISSYKKGDKKVSQEMMNRLWELSGRKINRFYLLGKSKYMLIDNVPDDDLLELEGREVDPDYDLLEKHKVEKQKHEPQPTETIEMLKGWLREKDERIADLKATIKDKDDLIATLKSRTAELRRIIDENGYGLQDFPFPIGAADSDKMPSKIR